MDLRQLERALAAFSVLNPTQFPIHHAQVFLVVAAQGRCTYEELEETLNLSNSTVSRTVHATSTARDTTAMACSRPSRIPMKAAASWFA
jgi:DNA-binding MarR family transcriptional regulator